MRVLTAAVESCCLRPLPAMRAMAAMTLDLLHVRAEEGVDAFDRLAAFAYRGGATLG
jgi:hypothetical protein